MSTKNNSNTEPLLVSLTTIQIDLRVMLYLTLFKITNELKLGSLSYERWLAEPIWLTNIDQFVKQ